MMYRVGRAVGAAAPALAIIVALYMVFGPMWAYGRIWPDGTIEEGARSSFQTANLIAIFWALVIVVLALLGGFAAWWGETKFVCIAAVPLLALSIISFAIGMLVASVALMLLLSAALLSLDSRRTSAER
jgi:hypothetical protein